MQSYTFFNVYRFNKNQNICHRLMQACIDVAFEYVHIRKQFDHPIGTFQLMQV